MPFARAGQMLHALTGVQVSEATVRRHTEQAGLVCEALQNEPEQPSSADAFIIHGRSISSRESNPFFSA